MVDRTSQGYAYVLLFAQQQAKDPSLTPAGFNAWLKAQVDAGIAAAKAQQAAKGGQ